MVVEARAVEARAVEARAVEARAVERHALVSAAPRVRRPRPQVVRQSRWRVPVVPGREPNRGLSPAGLPRNPGGDAGQAAVARVPVSTLPHPAASRNGSLGLGGWAPLDLSRVR
ncbi:hypothetical protein [Streptomyces violaceusniger]|uniref:hypothetical protein n=1 Tax=Streptomyces violaceusniger TaxID=68280 RepID=UPI00369AFBA6